MVILLMLPNTKTIAENEEMSCTKTKINIEKLKEAQSWINNNQDANIHSFLVHHCGELVFEDYFIGYDAIMPHDMQSATKSFSAMLIGVAIKDGYIKSVDQPLTELLPKYAHLLEGEKADITLYQVLNMTTGLKWVDFKRGNSFDKIIAAKDSVEFILSEPLLTKPGEKFAYNTGSSHLLSAIITATTGMSALEYANLKLFGPMKMWDYDWDVFKDGTNLGGWGIYMRPRDMMKLGQMILDDGRWQDEQIIDKSFIDQATTTQAVTDGGGGPGYGYQMWIPKVKGVNDVAAAMGFGGQFMFVMAELNAVVVFTASVETFEQNRLDIQKVMEDFVVPALQSAD